MDDEVKIACEFSILNMPPKKGTLTFKPNSDFVWFESEDGMTKTMVTREVLAQGNIEWPTKE